MVDGDTVSVYLGEHLGCLMELFMFGGFVFFFFFFKQKTAYEISCVTNSVVECNLAKVEVASSNLVSRSLNSTTWRIPSELVPHLYRIKNQFTKADKVSTASKRLSIEVIV